MAPESGTCSARSSSGAGGWSVDKEPKYFYSHLLTQKNDESIEHFLDNLKKYLFN